MQLLSIGSEAKDRRGTSPSQASTIGDREDRVKLADALFKKKIREKFAKNKDPNAVSKEECPHLQPTVSEQATTTSEKPQVDDVSSPPHLHKKLNMNKQKRQEVEEHLNDNNYKIFSTLIQDLEDTTNALNQNQSADAKRERAFSHILIARLHIELKSFSQAKEHISLAKSLSSVADAHWNQISEVENKIGKVTFKDEN